MQGICAHLAKESDFVSLEKSLAILFLSLIIVSRSFIFLFPKLVKDFMNKKILKWSDKHFIIIGGLLFFISITIFYYLLLNLTLAQVISVSFAFVLLFAALFMTHPDFYRTVICLLAKKDDNFVRKHAGLAVIIALILLFYVINS